MTRSTLSRIATLGVALSFLAAPQAFAAGTAPPKPVQSNADRQLERAIALIEAKDVEEAVPLLEKVVKAEPQNADAWNWMGYSKRYLGDFETADQAYVKALAIDPKHKGALAYQGELRVMQKDLAGAEVNLGKLIELCPSGCKERSELEKDIAKLKAADGSSS